MTSNRDPQTYAIIGAAMEVHGELGRGFVELPYKHSLEIEFRKRNIPYGREVLLPISYKGELLDCKFYADFICYETVLLEAKAVRRLIDEHRVQVINYLKATGLKKALLMNFGAKSLEYERIVLDY